MAYLWSPTTTARKKSKARKRNRQRKRRTRTKKKKKKKPEKGPKTDRRQFHGEDCKFRRRSGE